MTDFVTKDELNGLGGRLHTLELSHMTIKTITERNEKDIQSLFINFEEKAKAFSDKADKIVYGVIIASVILVIGMVLQSILTRQGA